MRTSGLKMGRRNKAHSWIFVPIFDTLPQEQRISPATSFEQHKEIGEEKISA